MTRLTGLLGIVAVFALTMPAFAQEGEPMADETPEDPTEVASTTHDWEFVLQPNEKAPDATATVMVTEGEAENAFVIEITGLPPVDDLDEETRDVNAYTVWIVPSRDRVQESTLAGALSIAPDGTATFEGSTDLDTFGILILATEDGAPETLSGVPVLTGIPTMEGEADATEGAAEATEGAADAAEDAADEAQPEAAVEPDAGVEAEAEAEVPQP